MTSQQIVCKWPDSRTDKRRCGNFMLITTQVVKHSCLSWPRWIQLYIMCQQSSCLFRFELVWFFWQLFNCLDMCICGRLWSSSMARVKVQFIHTSAQFYKQIEDSVFSFPNFETLLFWKFSNLFFCETNEPGKFFKFRKMINIEILKFWEF